MLGMYYSVTNNHSFTGLVGFSKLTKYLVFYLKRAKKGFAFGLCDTVEILINCSRYAVANSSVLLALRNATKSSRVPTSLVLPFTTYQIIYKSDI